MILRTFIAIDLPQSLLDALANTQMQVQAYLRAQNSTQGPTQYQEHGRKLGAALRWSPTQNLHLTLRFLGDTTADQRDEVSARLQEVAANAAPFTLRVDVSGRGLGGFPNLRQPRVLWAGVEGDLAALTSLQAQVEAVAQAVGFAPEEKRYSPHLTLARAARDADRRALSQVGERIGVFSREVATPVTMSFGVASLRFYQSEPGAGGSRYTVLAELPFGRV